MQSWRPCLHYHYSHYYQFAQTFVVEEPATTAISAELAAPLVAWPISVVVEEAAAAAVEEDLY